MWCSPPCPSTEVRGPAGPASPALPSSQAARDSTLPAPASTRQHPPVPPLPLSTLAPNLSLSASFPSHHKTPSLFSLPLLFSRQQNTNPSTQTHRPPFFVIPIHPQLRQDDYRGESVPRSNSLLPLFGLSVAVGGGIARRRLPPSIPPSLSLLACGTASVNPECAR